MPAYTPIASVVHSTLLGLNLPIHYYVQLLNYALDCLHELMMDSSGYMPARKSVKLTVNEFSELQLPDDFIDLIRIGPPAGQWVQRMYQSQMLNRLANEAGDELILVDYFTSGLMDNLDRLLVIILQAQVAYSDNLAGGYSDKCFLASLSCRGGHFGVGSLGETHGVQVIPERGIIQLSGAYKAGQSIIVDYLGFDVAGWHTMVSPYATKAIKEYIIWRYKEWSRQYSRFEVDQARRQFYADLRIYRGRINRLDKPTILKLLRKYQRLAPNI